MSFNFGSTAVSTSAPASGFSFGAAKPATSAPSTGFAFSGASSAAPAAPAGTTGFNFGGASSSAAPSATPSTTASSSGFNFGSTTAVTTAPATSSGFSFGGATKPATSGFSFGGTTSTAPATTTTTPATGSGFSFGGTTGGAAKPGFFGATPTTTTTPATTSGFGMFGQQQQATAGATATQPSITLDTVFDTLPADVKKNMTEFHKYLKDQDQSDSFLKTVSARKLDTLAQNLEQLEQDVLVRRNLQDRQATAVHHVRKDVKQLIHQVDTATLNLRSMSGESTSQRFYGIMRQVEMPSPYYWTLLDNFESRMELIKTQIESIEAEFQPLYERQGRNASSPAMDPALLQQILISQNQMLMQVAAHVAEVHERTEEMRQAFIRKMKQDLVKHGDKNLTTFKNPFDRKKKNSAARESEIDAIRFKTSVTPTIVATQQQPQQASMIGGGGMFGTTTQTSAVKTGGFGFGATPPTVTTGTPSTGTGGLFGGAGAPTINTGAANTTSGFGFGGGGNTATSGAKTVSFNLGGSTASTATTTAPATTSGFSFSATPATTPAAPATGGFSFSATPAGAATTTAPTFGAPGAVSTSFMPSTGEKRLSTSGPGSGSKSGGLRARQKKR